MSRAAALREFLDDIERSKTKPIADCTICHEEINPMQDYIIVALGYAHDSCQEFKKTQAEIRISENFE